MKQWTAFIQDIKGKVGISPKHASSGHLSRSASAEFAAAAARADEIAALAAKYESAIGSIEREKHELEQDFKRCWDHFLSSKSEKEKDIALSMTIDIFCILVKQKTSVAHLISLLGEARTFSFAIGKSFVTDIEKFRDSANLLNAGKIMFFLSGSSKDGIRCGSSLLFALEVLVLAPLDKQPLLDSGIFACLVHVLNSFINPDDENQRQSLIRSEGVVLSGVICDDRDAHIREVEVEESIMNIMKILAGHPSAALNLVEDDSLQILFQIISKGSLVAFSQFKQGLLPLRTVQLHRHTMQILSLVLLNDDGSSAKYIRKHHLIKILLTTLKDFRLEDGDSAYTVGIVDLLLECVELSCRPGAGSVRLKEDLHNAHGYQFLVQFALTLSCSQNNKVSPNIQSIYSKEEFSVPENITADTVIGKDDGTANVDKSPVHLYPSLSRLLDIIANLANTGLVESVSSYNVKPSHSSSEIWEKGNTKVQDLEAIQMLQDIFLKSNNVEVQAEVLDILFKIFSSHVENYQLCQQLRTVPLLVLNMAYFPRSLQERILKILDYAIAVVNCIPEQELLSLCCLLQQPISQYLQEAILSFFLKLLSFDPQYKKVLREIGVLEVLIDNLKMHSFISGSEKQTENTCDPKEKSNSNSFNKHLNEKDVILSSPRLLESGGAKVSMFEEDSSIDVAWDCLVSLLKKDESNQALFRSSNGLLIILPYLVLDIHRSGALRLLSCLIIEDAKQVHPEELGMLIEALKSGIVVNLLEFEYQLTDEAICDVLGILWRILGANSLVQRVFGEATGFSLLLTTLYSFQTDGQRQDSPMSLVNRLQIFSSLLRVMTAAVLGNCANRVRLHTIISSQTFSDFLHEASLICAKWEKQVIQLLLELAVEIVVPPFSGLQAGSDALSANFQDPNSFSSMFSNSPCSLMSGKERVYNAGAVAVLIRILPQLTPEVQLELLNFIEKLASASPFNQENLTDAGCVGILLDVVIKPFLTESSPLLMHALRVVEILGSYRLSTPELRELIRYTLEMKSFNSGYYLVDMMEKLIQRQDVSSANVSMAPFLEMDLSITGHASIQAPLGERSWPPVAGYSFVCWFKFSEHSNDQPSQHGSRSKSSELHTTEPVLRIFSVCAVDEIKTSYVELSLHGTQTLSFTTNGSSILSCSDLKLEDGCWHHLAIVHSKPNALTGLFQASVAYMYLDGKLRCSGNLGYSLSPIGKSLQFIIGTPIRSKVNNFSWSLRSCYLFEEVVTAGSICLMYILGRGYTGIFQDRDLLKFLPIQACGGDKMFILDSIANESTSVTKFDTVNGHKNIYDRSYGSDFVWDFVKLMNLFSDLAEKKLIFAFDGTSSEVQRASGRLSLLNLVDPKSAAASPFGGIPRFGLLNGDSYLCNQYLIGNCFRAVGGMAVILSLVEAAKTRDMLHMALSLLSCALQQNPQNVLDMRACRGYHLLAIFLHRRMQLFDMQSLDIFFQIATCEAYFVELEKSPKDQATNIESSEDNPKKVLAQSPKCIIVSNPDMIEHVLLDWTLWVTAPVSIQVALVGFLEQLVSLHWYRYHNLVCLRKINLVQHLLVTLQRDDVEVQVLEKIVILLSVILEDGFLASELDLVVRFVIMTFDPPEARTHRQIIREMMGKQVIVRNLLLEMLIDLQLTITSEDLLEQWYNILSLKFIMYFLDEYIHPTSMIWIMTLLGVCLAASPAFDDEFSRSGGYNVLTYVLPHYADSPDIYYIIFSLIFGKSVYPRKPALCIDDFHDLMPSDGSFGVLKFVDLLDSVASMAKSTFNRLSVLSILAELDDLSQVEDTTETKSMSNNHEEDLQFLQENSSSAKMLISGEAAAPSTTTSIMRFMVDMSKMCPPFSAICRRKQFLENCVDLYFSCVRAHSTFQMASSVKTKGKEGCLQETFQNLMDQQAPHSLVQEEEQFTEASEGIQNLFSSDVMEVHELHDFDEQCSTKTSSDSPVYIGKQAGGSGEPAMKGSEEVSFSNYSSKSPLSNSNFYKKNLESHLESNSSSFSTSGLAFPTKKSSSVGALASSPVLALASWLGSKGKSNGVNVQLSSGLLAESPSTEASTTQGLLRGSQNHQSSTKSTTLPIDSKLLVEIDNLVDTGCPTSAGASATLDFIAIILSDIISEKPKASSDVESILEAVPLYVDVETVLAFQGLCLSRMMTFLERRLLRDDEEGDKRLDKSIWSVNLGALCWLIVDRVYMGAFPQPVSVLKALEFVLSMLQLANTDGCIEKTVPSGRGLLARSKGAKQLETYIRALLKSANRLIMYCFLPSFLAIIGEEEFLSCLGFQTENRRSVLMKNSQDESGMDVISVLRLLFSHRHLVLCPSNLDTDLICCLCVNLIYILRDHRQVAQNLAVDTIKYLLSHRRAALEELLASNPYQGLNLNVLDGGFDKLQGGSLPAFFDWFHSSEQIINIALDQCAALMWTQYIGGSAKFPGIRIKGMEVRREREMGRKLNQASESEFEHWEHTYEQRKALVLVQKAVTTELKVICQDKYGWILHAESEWENHLQQLVHERGIIPLCHSSLDTEWMLCPIEGPYRMRKKFSRLKFKVERIQTFLRSTSVLNDRDHFVEKEKNDNILLSNIESDSNNLFEDIKVGNIDAGDCQDTTFETDELCQEDSTSSKSLNDRVSSVGETSLCSPQSKLDASSNQKIVTTSLSPGQASSIDEKKSMDDGEYLIRPYLEPLEKIRFKYNCERVVGLDKHDGIFLIGELCLYVIGNFYIDENGCINEKQTEGQLSVIDRDLGVTEDVTGGFSDSLRRSPSALAAANAGFLGGRAWAYEAGGWDKEKVPSRGNLPHPWHMWKHESVQQFLKRDYQLRPVAIELFSNDGCNDLLVFHKREREEVYKILASLNLSLENMFISTISGLSNQESNDSNRHSRVAAKSLSKRWQNGEMSNLQYLMHLNTLAGRGYNDLTQYPVFPWVLADYDSETLDLRNPKTFRKFDKPVGCQTAEAEEEFRNRYENWDDPDVPKFHFGSHYSSAGIVLFYLLRLPPFSTENQKLQGGQYDRADRLFTSIADTWLSATAKENTSDVKELIPEFFYLPEFLENRFNLNLGVKQSGEMVGDTVLPPWAKGSAREFIRKHREALECDYVSENLHHWIDLIFGYKQRGQAAEEAVNVFYYYTYEGSVDIDSISDPAMKASILAQINHFGQTPKQLFLNPHPKRRTDIKTPLNPLCCFSALMPHEVRKSSSSVSQIVLFHEKILIAGKNSLLKPNTYNECIVWGFPDCSLRFMTYDQEKIISTHESLHGGSQIKCAAITSDGQILVTGGDDGVVSIWLIERERSRNRKHLHLRRSLCSHTAKITCLYASHSYKLIVSGSEDCSVILWDLSSLDFVKQLAKFGEPVSAVYINELSGDIATAAGILLAVWSVNGDCLAVLNTSQLPSDTILSITTSTFSDWQDTNWYATGHQSGSIKVWNMVHCTEDSSNANENHDTETTGFSYDGILPEYRLTLKRILKSHNHPVTAVHLTSDLKQLLSGDLAGNLLSWTLPDESLKPSPRPKLTP